MSTTNFQGAHVEDFGPASVKVVAPTKFAAFEAALAYAAAFYPNRTYSMDSYLVGLFGGAILTGYGYELKF